MSIDHIETWVFDLDNTLYPPQARLFDQIETLMEGFMMRELAMDLAEAKRLRAAFWKSHGTTLAGLMDVYNVDPVVFLDEVHRLDLSHIVPDADLESRIAALPGRKVIYTNGSRSHGENVSQARGLRGAFDAVFGIEDAGYRPKPRRDAFDTVFAAAGIEPARAAFFEDDPRNLAAPHDMGMVTILVHGGGEDAPHIHHHTSDLTGFLTQISACGFPPR